MRRSLFMCFLEINLIDICFQTEKGLNCTHNIIVYMIKV